MEELHSKSVRLALISVPYGEGPQVMMPLGLMNIAGYVKSQLKEQVEVQVFDFSDSDPDNFDPLLEIKKWKADAIGISVYTSHVKAAVDWAKHLRALLPHAKLFAGGPHVSLNLQKFVDKWGTVFDFSVSGEGEVPILDALKALINDPELTDYSLVNIPSIGFLWRNESVLTKKASPLPADEWPNPLVNVKSARGRHLTFTDRKENRIRKAVALTSSRGCPMACSFCAIIVAGKDGPRWRACEAEHLLTWLEQEYKRESFEHVYLMDANFFVRPQRVREFSEGLSKRFKDVTWSTSSTVNYIIRMEKDIPILAEQGLRLVEMGIESGSQTQLDYLNKNATVAQNLTAVRILQRNNISIGLDFIMFYPDQTINEIRENLAFILKARLTQQEVFDHYLNLLILYPGTPLREKKEKELKIQFDHDELPNSESLIKNKNVAAIYSLFIHDFVKNYLSRINQAIIGLQRKISILTKQKINLKNVAVLRLEIIFLRHIPFKVLWYLTQANNFLDLDHAIPEYKSYINFLEKIELTLNSSKNETSFQPKKSIESNYVG